MVHEDLMPPTRSLQLTHLTGRNIGDGSGLRIGRYKRCVEQGS